MPKMDKAFVCMQHTNIKPLFIFLLHTDMRLQPFVATLALFIPDVTPQPKKSIKGRQQGFQVPQPTEYPYLVFQQ